MQAWGRTAVAGAPARTTGMGATFRRGLGAGLVAGIACGLFQLVAGEPSVEQAIRLEHMRSGGQAAEVLSRGVQRMGMVLATALYGVALGGVLAVVVAVMAPRMRGSAWERSLEVALAGFATFWLVPFLKYPANPPAVGDPATIGVRTASYLAMAVASVAGCFVALAVVRRLASAEPHLRQIAALGTYGCVVLVAFAVLPPAEPAGVPAELLWSFRLAAAGGQALLWTVAGAVLGLLTLRAERRAGSAAESALAGR